MLRVVLVAGLLAACVAPVAVPVSAQRAGDEVLSQQVDAYLSRLEGFGFSGAVLVARDGAIVLQSAHGLTDRRNDSPWTADTPFDVGSVTKQFTAAAILALESDGKLSVMDPIGKSLPDVPDDKAGITIHHLLTHTSGLVNGFGGDYQKVSRDELVRRALTSELQSPPGERHAYSNVGFSVLAAIVEIVSEQSYDAFVRERLFVPAGMTASGYALPEPQAGRVARGYEDGEDQDFAEQAAATGGEMWNLIGNGGLHSTLADLHRWTRALDEGEVLSAEARQKLFQPHALVYADYKDSGSPLHYGYGWYVWKQPSGEHLIWHLGGNGVLNAALRHHVDDGTWVIYASNVSEFHDPAYPVPAIERMLAGEAVPLPPRVVPITPEQLADHAGRYQAPSGAMLSLQAEDGFLRIYGEGQEAFSFVRGKGWAGDAPREALNARTAQVVENGRTGDYAALLLEYDAGTTLDGLAEFEAAFWKKRHDAYGDFVRTRVLGTIPAPRRQPGGTTIVAVDLERGTAYREYIWTADGRIGDVGPLNSVPSTRCFPVSANAFVRFDAASAEATSLTFERQEDGGVVAILAQGELRVQLQKRDAGG